MPTEARWLIRGGGGGGGGQRKGECSSAQSDPQKTEEAVDRRQNNSYVKAAGTSPLRSSCCFNWAPWTYIHVYICKSASCIVQKLCESRGGRQSWAVRPGRKAILNHASALVSACP